MGKIIHLSVFPPEEGGGDTRGIRLQTNLNPRELDRANKPWGGKLDVKIITSSGISKLNYITNLIAHPSDFRHHVFAQGWEIRPHFLKRIVSFPMGIPPLG